jgi:RNA polymerase sigma factor (TIGR02999 family)
LTGSFHTVRLEPNKNHVSASIMAEVTQILSAIEHGQAKSEELLPIVYDELRRLAAARLAQERPGQTLQATALVHEAWHRLAMSEPRNWQGRQHFFAAAAQAMRRILVENARRKRRLRHGGDLQRVEIGHQEIASPIPSDELLALDDALQRLAQAHPDAAELVQLCFFAGMTQAEAGEQMGVSRATAERTWAFAKAWLFREIRKNLNPPS